MFVGGAFYNIKNFRGKICPTLKRASFILWNNISTIFSCKTGSNDNPRTTNVTLALPHSSAGLGTSITVTCKK
jgi:hypothetical protein